MTASAVAASRAPSPASSAERIPFVSTWSLLIATLNRKRSMSSVTARIVRWVRRRSCSGSGASRSHASPTAAKTRPSHVVTPGRFSGSGAISFQSMSSSNGPANRMFRRIESAPQRSTSGIGSTMLPLDLLIDAPPKITCPWFISRFIGSVKPTIPMSNSTLVKKRQ